MPTTPSWSCPAPMRWSTPRMSRAAILAKAMCWSASSKFRSRRSTPFSSARRAAGARTILNPAPAIDVRSRAARSRRYPGAQRNRTRHFSPAPSFGRTMTPARFIEAARPAGDADQIVCVTLGKRGVLALIDGETPVIPGRTVKAVDTTGPAIASSARLRRSSRAASRSATRSTTPIPRRRSACSGWAPHRRCRRRRKWPDDLEIRRRIILLLLGAVLPLCRPSPNPQADPPIPALPRSHTPSLNHKALPHPPSSPS